MEDMENIGTRLEQNLRDDLLFNMLASELTKQVYLSINSEECRREFKRIWRANVMAGIETALVTMKHGASKANQYVKQTSTTVAKAWALLGVHLEIVGEPYAASRLQSVFNIENIEQFREFMNPKIKKTDLKITEFQTLEPHF